MSPATGNKTFINKRNSKSIPMVPQRKWRPMAAIRSTGPEGKKKFADICCCSNGKAKSNKLNVKYSVRTCCTQLH